MPAESMGQSLALWAIRITVTLYVLRIALELRQRFNIRDDETHAAQDGWRPSTAIVVVWIAACICYSIHVVLSMGWFHDWSYQSALDFTAQETNRVVGIRRGEGIWANFILLLVWPLDCWRLWIRCQRRHFVLTPVFVSDRTLDRLAHFLFAGMMLSATVVFGPNIYRWLFPPVLLFWWVSTRASTLTKNSEVH